MNFEELKNLAISAGFTYAAELDINKIELQKAVRDMCAANQCGQYGKNWSCPPGCGTLEECRNRLTGYHKGILVQTVGKVEDSFDYEGMMQLETMHKQQFIHLQDLLLAIDNDILPLGVGCCNRCIDCTYPKAPCRMPDKCISSMEAYGMMVMQVCKNSGMRYYYGYDHMAYTSCILLR